MFFRFLLLFQIGIFIFNPDISWSQNCIITGVIKDKKTRESLVGATILIQGTTQGTTADIDGNYTIENLKPGTYTLEISYISFKKEILKNIKLTPEKPVHLEICLEEDSKYIEGVIVKERRKTDTDISIINAIKQSNIQMTGLSRQQISRSMDKNAAEAIRRVPGVTIIDDKFIIVRGLIDRYNSVLLNQTSTPSFETDKKSFSFDIIPSSTLDRLILYKTPAP